MRTTKRFSRDVSEIPRTRRFVAETLERAGVPASDAVLLVASELITNAVRHGEGTVELRILLEPECVRLEVLDEGRVVVRAPSESPSPSALGGRGLLLVEGVSDRWGSRVDESGRTLVWAELSLDGV
ncbi:MAG TPA: ATP-binding protein [Acidimicrobiales bacterium]|nr:ATP-binding protein [Acidimicrobiales bacterium]